MESDTLLTGSRLTSGWAPSRTLYFAIEFSKPVKSYGLVNQEEQIYRGFWRRFDQDHDFPERVGRRIKCHFDWQTTAGEQIIGPMPPTKAIKEDYIKIFEAWVLAGMPETIDDAAALMEAKTTP